MEPIKQSRPQLRGSQGERLALEHYAADGYRLLCANYRVRGGEIDLILESATGVLVFAEVKTRRAGAAVLPREAVDAKKQRKIAVAAQLYLAKHNLSEPFMRFDVVEVTIEADGTAHINRLESAFDPQ